MLSTVQNEVPKPENHSALNEFLSAVSLLMQHEHVHNNIMIMFI